jgi:hypothetical protein
MAAGDISLTAAVTQSIPSFTFIRLELDLRAATLAIQYQDARGDIHGVMLADTTCIGFGISGSVISDNIARAVTGEYTGMLGVIFGTATGNANARRTAMSQKLITDGIVTVTGTVG